MQNLISGIVLGDRRPSQMLAQMRDLYRGDVDHPIIRNLFLARLPSMTRQIISGMMEYRPANQPEPTTEQIAHWADTIVDGGDRNNIQAISDQTSELSTLKQQIEALASQVGNLTKHLTTKQQSRPPNQEVPADGICFYHRNYGKNRHANKKCLPLCKLHQEWQAAHPTNSDDEPKN